MASNKQSTTKRNSSNSTSKANISKGSLIKAARRLFVMRHGERCDFAFGRSWVSRSFSDDGGYQQVDLNLPSDIIPRDNQKDYLKDSPLTEIGKCQARITGEALKREGINIQHVYSSPAFRSVQTAQNVIIGMGNNAKMCIEPPAFEWFGWYKNAMPNWIPPQDLANAGFSIDTTYRPSVSISNLNLDETVTDYYERCHNLAKHILSRHQEDKGDILIVAHAGSLDTFTRGLRGLNSLNNMEMHDMLASFTYCCLCCLGQEANTGRWELMKPPIPPLHGFNWEVML